jgi:hypothetical protein
LKEAVTIVLNNNTLQNIQLINLANGNNKLEYEIDTDKPVNLSVPDPPERNLGDAGFLNPKAKKINLRTERSCCCTAQMVSAFPSTANSTGGKRRQRHRVGEIGKVLQGEPKVGIKGKECHTLLLPLQILLVTTQSVPSVSQTSSP